MRLIPAIRGLYLFRKNWHLTRMLPGEWQSVFGNRAECQMRNGRRALLAAYPKFAVWLAPPKVTTLAGQAGIFVLLPPGAHGSTGGGQTRVSRHPQAGRPLSGLLWNEAGSPGGGIRQRFSAIMNIAT